MVCATCGMCVWTNRIYRTETGTLEIGSVLATNGDTEQCHPHRKGNYPQVEAIGFPKHLARVKVRSKGDKVAQIVAIGSVSEGEPHPVKVVHGWNQFRQTVFFK